MPQMPRRGACRKAKPNQTEDSRRNPGGHPITFAGQRRGGYRRRCRRVLIQSNAASSKSSPHLAVRRILQCAKVSSTAQRSFLNKRRNSVVRDAVTLIECPRDAWQGLSRQIPTELKTRYLRALID